MMEGVAHPTFPACLGEYIAAAYSGVHMGADGGAECCHADPYTPITPHPLLNVGDEMVNVALTGRLVAGTHEFPDEGAYPFVRVGRVVVMFNPPASKSIYNTPGYPDGQLDQTLQIAVKKLRAAQTG